MSRGKQRELMRSDGSPYPEPDARYRKESAGIYGTDNSGQKDRTRRDSDLKGSRHSHQRGHNARSRSREPRPKYREEEVISYKDSRTGWSANLSTRSRQAPTLQQDDMEPLQRSEKSKGRVREGARRRDAPNSSKRFTDTRDDTTPEDAQAESSRLQKLLEWRSEVLSLRETLGRKLNNDLKHEVQKSFRDRAHGWAEQYRWKEDEVINEFDEPRCATVDRFHDVFAERTETIYGIHRNDPRLGIPSRITNVQGLVETRTLPKTIYLKPVFEMSLGGQFERREEPEIGYKKIGRTERYFLP